MRRLSAAAASASILSILSILSIVSILSILSILSIVACTSFTATPAPGAADADASADGSLEAAAPACAAPSCADAGPSCHSSDFETGCDGWTFSGDIGRVTGTCTGGKLRVAADSTLDLTAELELTTPGELASIEVSARIAVANWDGGALLAVSVDGVTVSVIGAVVAASGNIRFRLCDAMSSCAPDSVELSVGEEHVFALVLTGSGAELSVDCHHVATFSAVQTIAASRPLVVAFGKVDANPISGTLDDVVVSYR